MIDFTKIWIAAGLTAIMSFSLTPFAIEFARRFDLVDDKKKRAHPAQIHTGVIPRAGGLPIFLSILVGTLIFIPMSKIIAGILLGSTLIIVMGILDDKYDLSALSRLLMSFGIVGLVILFGLGIPYITNPFGGVIDLEQYRLTLEIFGKSRDFLLISNIFSLLWIVGLMNFVSWSSGVDGQLPGFVGISSIFLGVLAFRFSGHDISNESVALLSFIVGAAFLGFLPWHFYPQKIMPGYSGGTLAGFLLGVLSILSWGKIGTLMLVLSVPLVDAMYIILRRLREGRSPMSNDAGHFHHRLMQIGWGKRRIAVFYWVVSFVFGIAAVSLHSIHKVLALLIVVVLLALFIAITHILKEQRT